MHGILQVDIIFYFKSYFKSICKKMQRNNRRNWMLFL